jgi:serine palmitoyltransferase
MLTAFDELHPHRNGGRLLVINNKESINLATFNFHNLLGDKDVQMAAERGLDKYGCGACGPRGFYGTFDVHLELENCLAKFFGKEEAAVYSYGFSAIASVIPSYSKKSDIIFCDEGVSFPIQKGIELSRSKVRYFKHNNMDHLEELLEAQREQDTKNPAKAKVTRKFIIAEAIYMNYGDMAPLPKLVELRNKYKVPILLDESLSFGVLGEGGHGATEHWGVSVDDVDVIMASLENALASSGGFATGKSYVINHQRLSGSAYCFSASLPPLCAMASIRALSVLEENGHLFSKLKTNVKLTRELFSNIPGLRMSASDPSPVIHLYLLNSPSSRQQEQQILEKVVSYALDNGVALSASKYLEDEEQSLPPPSIRVVVNSALEGQDIEKASEVAKEAFARYVA